MQAWALMLQIELHPYNPEHELKKYCESEGILLQAYSPLGSTRMSSNPLSQSSIMRYSQSPFSISIAALLQTHY